MTEKCFNCGAVRKPPRCFHCKRLLNNPEKHRVLAVYSGTDEPSTWMCQSCDREIEAKYRARRLNR
jgi:RNase P subunit RPR2